MAEVIVLDRGKSLIKRPVFDMVTLVTMCEHGPASREQFALAMLATHRGELELLINSASTPEQQNIPKGITMAEHMFPRHAWHELIEVNRTMQMIYLWVLIVSGRYDLFTECQKWETRLSPESFEEMQSMVGRYLGEDPFEIIEVIQRLKIVMAGMSVHDAGKSRGLVSDLLKSVGVTDFDMEDHDSLLKTLLDKAPKKISESFARLKTHERETLAKFFSVDLILGQVAQGEATGRDIEHSGLRLLDEDTRYMWYMKEVLDIAGAAGQSVQNGSLILTEQTWQGIKGAINELERYAKQEHSGIASMRILVNNRVDRMALIMARDRNDHLCYSMGRIALMLRKFDFVDINEIYGFMKEVSLSGSEEETKRTHDLLAYGLGDSIEGRPAFLTYYSPALFANLIKHLGYERGVKTALILLARIFAKVKDYLIAEDVSPERMTLFLEEVARTAADPAVHVLEKKIVIRKTAHGELNIILVD